MNIQERLEAFWSGERPDQIPFTIYQNEWRHTADDPAWQEMFQDGLGVTWHIPSVRWETKDVEDVRNSIQENGRTVERRTLLTPVGEVYETFIDGWRQKFFLETAEDYAVMTHVVRHTEVFPAYDMFLSAEQGILPYGIALIAMGRTPIQTILVDYAGLENFCFHLFDLESEVMELYDALLENLKRQVELVAEGPGRFVSILENFTAETLGPTRYKQLLLSVYQELFPVLQNAGKIVGTHYDGKLASCKDLVAKAPIDLIESLTPPPEGDMTLAECRAAWPDKLFWSNVNVACYDLPSEQLKSLLLERVEQAAPDGRRLAFEVSEQYPDNWKESLPVVLEALGETRL
ncbi:MAG: hypothetical protein V3S14_15580 [Anaerolineae bacterium]